MKDLQQRVGEFFEAFLKTEDAMIQHGLPLIGRHSGHRLSGLNGRLDRAVNPLQNVN